MAKRLLPSFVVRLLCDDRVRLLSGCREHWQVRLFVELTERWGEADMPQTIFASFNQELAEFFLRFGRGVGSERYPVKPLLAIFLFNGDPGKELAVPPPEPANRVLAVVQNLVVGVTAGRLLCCGAALRCAAL